MNIGIKYLVAVSLMSFFIFSWYSSTFEARTLEHLDKMSEIAQVYDTLIKNVNLESELKDALADVVLEQMEAESEKFNDNYLLMRSFIVDNCNGDFQVIVISLITSSEDSYPDRFCTKTLSAPELTIS